MYFGKGNILYIFDYVGKTKLIKYSTYTLSWRLRAVNHGDYIRAVFDRNTAENISRVLYPVDNVRIYLYNIGNKFIIYWSLLRIIRPTDGDAND